jgi:phosphoadenosine phosphosulfate reductase
VTIETTASLALAEKARKLNAAFAGKTAPQMLSRLLHGGVAGRVAVVSSFGAEAACLLSLVASKEPSTPVVFLDTRKHFRETLAYVDDLMDQLGLTTLVRARPTPARLQADDPVGELNKRDPDRCCYLRKTLPMVSVLSNFDCVLTGRKRFQTDDRAQMDIVEVQESWLRVNPLHDWTHDQVQEYLAANNILRHPLVAEGYPSIGCEPCTQPSADIRGGRWAGTDKTECGIHITSEGKIVRVRSDDAGTV